MPEKPKKTEEEILFHDGVEVILGGEKYPVKPLTLRKDREWRQKLSALMASLPKYTQVTTDKPEEFGGAIEALLATNPDKVTELFFDYTCDLRQEDFEDKATAVEVAMGFKQVMKLAFPLPRALTEAMMEMSP
ncbi:MAG TPA: hypothetical protein VMV84_05215 [Dehalococcoidales bacterium]|nr:hypothetical protein [Dehalococcoidales bacterium]